MHIYIRSITEKNPGTYMYVRMYIHTYMHTHMHTNVHIYVFLQAVEFCNIATAHIKWTMIDNNYSISWELNVGK